MWSSWWLIRRVFRPSYLKAEDGAERSTLGLLELSFHRVQLIYHKGHSFQWPGGPRAPYESSASQFNAPWGQPLNLQHGAQPCASRTVLPPPHAISMAAVSMFDAAIFKSPND
jgi:hypothetical protein